ncbi:hypothetical protein FRZ06_17590 [Anoxybacterium hadale]|uniref:Uncharacterized protein n=1 Tax=Anoxybacterium hadale TaxID=3408580 RepID=A0ACD1AFT5_9FIRM|nr:hypothetical protein FRZ06_17590 [Clostridiales bacterium]
MNYVKYNRSFVMMEEQNNQFAARESAPIKGYLKVETGNNKGALRCTVQNLKYYEKGDYIYKLILFGKKGERTIHTTIGNLVINRQGNGESYFRFLPGDLDGKGNAYHNYSTAIVAAASTKDEKEPLHPVLKGVTLSEGESFQSELFQISDEDEQEEDTDFEKIMNQIDQIVEEVEEAMNGNEIPMQAKEATSDDLLPSEAAVSSKDEAITKKTYNSFYNEYILNACAHTCRVAEFYEDVFPFDKDKTGARWKKIDNTSNLPMVSPGAHYFATQYRHYIFGAKADESGVASRFYFGIPGRFLSEEQPDGGKSGFTYWQPIRGADHVFEQSWGEENKNQGAYGYWIVSINGTTGSIEEV